MDMRFMFSYKYIFNSILILIIKKIYEHFEKKVLGFERKII